MTSSETSSGTSEGIQLLKNENEILRRYIEQLEAKLVTTCSLNSLKNEKCNIKGEIGQNNSPHTKKMISKTGMINSIDHSHSVSSSNLCSPPRLFGAGGLTKSQIIRYNRQMLLKELTSINTKRLIEARVLVVGAGGLASTIIPYLAASGVGFLRIVDFDVVERSNLHRQIIHTDARAGDIVYYNDAFGNAHDSSHYNLTNADSLLSLKNTTTNNNNSDFGPSSPSSSCSFEGMPKVISAKLSALAINPAITVEAIPEKFSLSNCERFVKDVDVVVDATDNAPTRYLMNDCSVMQGKPLVSGAALRWDGQLTVYNYKRKMIMGENKRKGNTSGIRSSVSGEYSAKENCNDARCEGKARENKDDDDIVEGNCGPCYRCLFPQPPLNSAAGSCSEMGVVGPVPGIIGALQALETIKVLLTMERREQDEESERLNGVCNPRQGQEEGDDKMEQQQPQKLLKNEYLGLLAVQNIEVLDGKMLLFDGLRMRWKTIQLRGKQANCPVCFNWQRKNKKKENYHLKGEKNEPHSITPPFTIVCPPCFDSLQEAVSKYNLFNEYFNETCYAAEPPIIDETLHISKEVAPSVVQKLWEKKIKQKTHQYSTDFSSLSSYLIIDTRVPLQFDIMSIQPSHNVPLTDIIADPRAVWKRIKDIIKNDAITRKGMEAESDDIERGTTDYHNDDTNTHHLYFLCRRGITSRKSIKVLLNLFESNKEEYKDDIASVRLLNITGGLAAWSKQVGEIPNY